MHIRNHYYVTRFREFLPLPVRRAQDGLQAASPVLWRGMDLLEEPAGHPRWRAAPLLPRSDGLDVDSQELAEGRLADAHHRTDSFDLIGTERPGFQVEFYSTDSVTLLDRRAPASIASRNRSRAATIFKPFSKGSGLVAILFPMAWTYLQAHSVRPKRIAHSSESLDGF